MRIKAFLYTLKCKMCPFNLHFIFVNRCIKKRIYCFSTFTTKHLLSVSRRLLPTSHQCNTWRQVFTSIVIIRSVPRWCSGTPGEHSQTSTRLDSGNQHTGLLQTHIICITQNFLRPAHQVVKPPNGNRQFQWYAHRSSRKSSDPGIRQLAGILVSSLHLSRQTRSEVSVVVRFDGRLLKVYILQTTIYSLSIPASLILSCPVCNPVNRPPYVLHMLSAPCQVWDLWNN